MFEAAPVKMDMRMEAEAARIIADALELHEDAADIVAYIVVEFEKVLFLRFERQTYCLPFKSKWHCLMERGQEECACCDRNQATMSGVFQVGEARFVLFQTVLPHKESTCPDTWVNQSQ